MSIVTKKSKTTESVVTRKKKSLGLDMSTTPKYTMSKPAAKKKTASGVRKGFDPDKVGTYRAGARKANTIYENGKEVWSAPKKTTKAKTTTKPARSTVSKGKTTAKTQSKKLNFSADEERANNSTRAYTSRTTGTRAQQKQSVMYKNKASGPDFTPGRTTKPKADNTMYVAPGSKAPKATLATTAYFNDRMDELANRAQKNAEKAKAAKTETPKKKPTYKDIPI